jgi:hypothetical protein
MQSHLAKKRPELNEANERLFLSFEQPICEATGFLSQATNLFYFHHHQLEVVNS